MDDITAVLYEPDAGVVRARRAAQAAAAVFEQLGGKIVIGRATPSKISNGRLEEITLDTGDTLRADTFVFAVGPWLGKTFPDIFAKKTRVPMGYVCYFATPIGDHRFTYPNIPSYNFPGVTGWPALPVDNRGFRVRGAERAPTPPVARRCGGRWAPARRRAPAASTARRRDARQPMRRRRDTGVDAAGAAATVAAVERRRARWTRRRWRSWRAVVAGGAAAAGRSAGAAGSRYERSLGGRMTRIDGSRRFVAHRFPLLKDAPIAQTHACHYESTSSGNFIIDKHPQWSNVWIAAGGNAEGFKFAPRSATTSRSA